jgi:hypothetical protein
MTPDCFIWFCFRGNLAKKLNNYQFNPDSTFLNIIINHKLLTTHSPLKLVNLRVKVMKVEWNIIIRDYFINIDHFKMVNLRLNRNYSLSLDKFGFGKYS